MALIQQRQELFAREYVVDGNGTRAALAAGYSQTSAAETASELLRNSKVANRIAELQAKRLSKLDIKADRVLEELAKIAFSDPRQFFREDGSLKPINELDADTAACLAGFDVEELFQHFGKGQASEIGQVKKYKMADRLRALELLGKTMAMFIEKIKHEGLEGLADAIAKGRKRLADG